MNITNGKVVYTRRLNTGDFSHKDAQVELTFCVNDGEEPRDILAYVGQVALAQALVMTGEQAPTLAAPPNPIALPETAAAKGRRTRAAAAPPPGPTLAEAASALVEAAQSLPGPVPATATAAMPVTVQSPLPAGNVVPLPTAAGPSTPPVTAVVPAATPTVPVAGLPSVGETGPSTGAIVQAISDETLGQKVTAKLTEMRDILGVAQDVAVAKIHATIQQFTGQPQGRLVDIAAEQRELFVTALTALS